MRFRLMLETVSPLSISQGHMVAGDVRKTLNYISGTALRGALAIKYLNTPGKREDSEEFKTIFLSDSVKFGNLYPGNEGSIPLPVTARTCKRKRGFKGKDEGHGVVDSLLHLLHLYASDMVKDYSPPGYLDQCREQGCSGLMDRFIGFYLCPSERREYQKVEPRKRLISRTAISSKRQAAKMRALYTIEVIEEGEKFAGFIEIADNLSESIKPVLESLLIIDDTIFLGVARTRGLGLAKIGEFIPYNESRPPFTALSESLKKRINNFNEQRKNIFAGEKEKSYFVLTLWSDTIIMDKFMRYQSWIDEVILAQETKRWEKNNITFPTGIKMIRHFSTTRYVSGWNIKWGLPKEDEVAIVCGSVFLFKFPEEEKDRVIRWLSLLEEEGIGERKNEGFGKVIVCHPFHREVKPI